MSWLARSIANSLQLDDEEDQQIHNNDADPEPPQSGQHSLPPSSSAATTPRGVSEDISELTKTLSRQFWGVASFLAPPPEDDPKPDPDPTPIEGGEEEDLMKGIRNDFAEIGGKFKSGISKLSSNAAVFEITKIASNFLQFGSQEGEEEGLIGAVVGLTDEVVVFARDLAMHPETWLDFPVPDDDTFEEFDMSDTQQEHALAVERLAPRLAALRMELCPGYMSEGCFWKIYFVLLHPRLSKDDSQLLSSPEIVEARAMLSQELQKKPKAKSGPGWSGVDTSQLEETSNVPWQESLSVSVCPDTESELLKASVIEEILHVAATKAPGIEAVVPSVAAELETEKHPVQSTEMRIIDKNVVEEQPNNQTRNSSTSPLRVLDENFEDDADDWLKEETSEMVSSNGSAIPLGNDEDVSFSDLEEDDADVPTSYKKVMPGFNTSGKDSRDWVQLSSSSDDNVKDINPVNVKHARSEQVSAGNSDNKESNDWLDVDDMDGM